MIKKKKLILKLILKILKNKNNSQKKFKKKSNIDKDLKKLYLELKIKRMLQPYEELNKK